MSDSRAESQSMNVDPSVNVDLNLNLNLNLNAQAARRMTMFATRDLRLDDVVGFGGRFDGVGDTANTLLITSTTPASPRMTMLRSPSA